MTGSGRLSLAFLGYGIFLFPCSGGLCLRWDLLGVFLMTGVRWWGRRKPGVQCCFQHQHLGVPPHCWRYPWRPVWGGVCQVSLLYSYTFLPPLCAVIFGRISLCVAHTEGVMLHLLKGRVSALIIWCSVHVRGAFSPRFKFISSFIYLSMVLWVMIRYLYLFLQLFQF